MSKNDPPNERPVSLDYDHWKDALAEFIDRQDEANEDEDTDDDSAQ